MLPEARVNKEPIIEFPEIFLTEPCSGSHWMPYASQRIPQQISCLLGGSFTIEDPPGSTSLGSFSRPLTPMHFSGFSGQIPHQVTLGAQGESSSPTLSQSRLQACPGRGGARGIQRTLTPTPASSLLSILLLRQVPGTHPSTCSNLGALHWGVGGVEKRRKTSPIPHPGVEEPEGQHSKGTRRRSGSLQRGGRDSCPWETETLRDQQETRQRPGKGDPEMGEGAERPEKREQKAGKSTETQGKNTETQEKEHRDQAKSTESREKEHRDPARESRETPEGVADSRETPGLLGGWSGLKVGGRDTGRQRSRGFEGRRETETRREKEK